MDLDKIQEKLNNVPNASGVYLWKNEKNEVIYVGKAKRLYKRLQQYLKGSINSYKTSKMMQEVSDFDFFITNNETEALILEKNYIARYNPPYNLKLTDDKRYPYICVQIAKNAELKISSVYRLSPYSKDTFYYGPFPSNTHFKELLDVLQRMFMYENGLRIAKPIYAESKFKFNQVVDILKFQDMEFLNKLIQLRDAAASNYNFELAATYRDAYNVLNQIKQQQLVELKSYKDIDVFSFETQNNAVSIQKVFYRYGVQIEHENQFHVLNIPVEEFIVNYLESYYENNQIPQSILLDYNYNEIEFTNAKLAQKVQFPIAGVMREVVELANLNNKTKITTNYKEWEAKNTTLEQTWGELEKLLNNGNKISSIFIFDNSHFALSAPVGVATCWENGFQVNPKSSYFNHAQEFEAMNKHSDLELMYLTIAKFIQRNAFMLDKNTIFIVDGFILQIQQALYALKEQGIDYIKVYGLVKNEKHQTKYLINDQDQILPISQSAFNLLANMQYSVDRYAKNMMNKKYTADSRNNSLTQIKGIGKVTEEKLLLHFKTYQAIKNASLQQLAEVIDEKKAKIIYENYCVK
ncbi:excinuclease ABC subunit UvrC [Mycoplasma seminis]|uniref:Excinuclease ABC subunit UvrC n=1 Tax=Mycoplasma seminis TaxID=512749 RepID=A0ABY9H9H6_9MOLU|nr:excinuclease ABC subunit UvrC [Mycoplasma seminis]WLP85234.1 excinuclease ABC subunit UvrC [Mycoplasma seminis]